MTKRHFVMLLLMLVLITLTFWWGGRQIDPAPPVLPVERPKPVPSTETIPEKRETMGDRTAGPSEQSPSNKISQDWQQQLEAVLWQQGGDELKAVDVVKERSLIWKNEGISLHVESVRITLTNNKQESTSFRALVDSQTGKILETWDQPVIDPINPREGHRIKLDPRYLEAD
jgi:hypothetical protein